MIIIHIYEKFRGKVIQICIVLIHFYIGFPRVKLIPSQMLSFMPIDLDHLTTKEK